MFKNGGDYKPDPPSKQLMDSLENLGVQMWQVMAQWPLAHQNCATGETYGAIDNAGGHLWAEGWTRPQFCEPGYDPYGG
jgi:hypothetical protein